MFVQSNMLLNFIENRKGKYQFGELKSCYPMTTKRYLDFSISNNDWPCQQFFSSNTNIMKVETVPF